MTMLKFSEANAKTEKLRELPELQPYLANKRKVYSLDLLSGWSCPGACDCLARVHELNGKRSLKDGPKTKFRCFSASQEVAYTNTYKARRHNFHLIKNCRGTGSVLKLLAKSMPKNLGVLRWHVAGDFFKLAYLEAAIELARMNPDRLFYAYTKSLKFLAEFPMLDPSNGVLLPNFLVTSSRGGKYDELIDQIGVRTSTVVFDENTDLPIDHDDSHAATMGGDFALLLHGVQPAGSEASEARKALNGRGSYRKG
jgi:hypothetical protein